AMRTALPEASVEVLIPDFQGDETSLQTVLDAGPDVLNHNLETVKRLQAAIRPQASYGRSLSVLRAAARAPNAPAVKSGVMVGLGETDEELLEAIRDLYDAGVRLLTIGQYLQPTRAHRPVMRFVTPETFAQYETFARSIGFFGIA